jgi:hypothetical protein
MIFSLRPFLVTFLVLLQFIAPLVHAHTSEKISSQGLHIPGLEVYGHSAPENAIHSTQSLCKVSSFCSDIDGQVVSVDTGLSREATLKRFYKIMVDLHHDSYLPAPQIPRFKSDIFAFAAVLPTQSVLLVGQLACFAHSPRAPPAQV